MWIPPDHVLEARTLVRLRKDLVDERRKWRQRIQGQLFHQGLPGGIRLTTDKGRARVAAAELSAAGRQVVGTGAAGHRPSRATATARAIDRQLIGLAKRQPGCQGLTRLYGVGHLTAVAIWAELRDCRRFSNSDDAVRYAGLDITVYDSDGKGSPGHLSRQGPEVLRWALYEAAQSAARPGLPEHSCYLTTKARIGHNRACLAVARARCVPHQGDGHCGRLPHDSCRHGWAVDGHERPSGRHAFCGVTRSVIMSPELGSEHRDKAGRPRAGIFRATGWR